MRKDYIFRMKVMHNIGLLLVRMGKFRDAVTNFQHIMHEQGDFQTGKTFEWFLSFFFSVDIYLLNEHGEL